VSSAREPLAWAGIIEKTRAFVKERFAVFGRRRKELRVPFEMFYFVGV
jgi:hypothetical protein